MTDAGLHTASVPGGDVGADPAGPRLTWLVGHETDDHTTITFTGRFDAVEAMAARARMAEPDVTTPAHLVLDLHAVTFLDSAGLAVLVRSRQDRQRGGRTIALVRPASEDAMRVLRLTQFDQIFTMLDRPPLDRPPLDRSPGGP